MSSSMLSIQLAARTFFSVSDSGLAVIACTVALSHACISVELTVSDRGCLLRAKLIPEVVIRRHSCQLCARQSAASRLVWHHPDAMV